VSDTGGMEAAEIAELRARLRRLVDEAAANEQKLQRTLERELELLRAESLPELFELVTGGLAASYSLDAVLLVIEDAHHEIQHLLLGAGHRPADYPAVRFVDTLVGLAPQFAALRRPWLGGFVRADHGLLFGNSTELRTLAFLPLRRLGRTVGVLCFASGDAERFSHRHGADFLQHLASVVAVCLENACNRARVLRSGLSDYLTGWHNRRYLNARLREELARSQRTGASVACMMIDVDFFKAINDRFGHAGGDEVLREVAARIEGHVRASDTAARFGGDEFTLLLPETSLEDAMRLAERIRAALEPEVEVLQGQVCRVTLSIGAAAVPAPDRGADLKGVADRLLGEADAALYRAKAAGRNRAMASPG
jgi:diguanylate cyclase (GGDEF)-like protein